RRRHTRSKRDWSSDVCSSDLEGPFEGLLLAGADAVEGDAEVLHTHARSHGGVLSEGISMVRPAAAGVTSAAQRDPRSGAYTTGAGRRAAARPAHRRLGAGIDKAMVACWLSGESSGTNDSRRVSCSRNALIS